MTSYIPTLRDDLAPPQTPQALQARKELALNMLKGAGNQTLGTFHGSPVYTGWNGANDAANRILGAAQLRDVQDRELAGTRAAGLAALGVGNNIDVPDLPKDQTQLQSSYLKASASLSDPAVARVFAEIESGGDPNLGWNATGNRGLMQFGAKEEKRYGLNEKNWNDGNEQVRALGEAFGDYTNALAKAGIKDPSPWQVYLTHNQGISGGAGNTNC